MCRMRKHLFLALDATQLIEHGFVAVPHLSDRIDAEGLAVFRGVSTTIASRQAANVGLKDIAAFVLCCNQRLREMPFR